MSEVHLELMDKIDAEKVEHFLKILKEKTADDCTHLHLAIQSRGGSIPIALALANLLINLSIPITTYNIGNIDSSALVVFAAGNKRICSTKGLFRTHPIGKEVKGVQTIETLTLLLQEIKEDTKQVSEFLASRTKITPKNWSEIMHKSVIISSKEALKMGLVHCIGEYCLK